MKTTVLGFPVQIGADFFVVSVLLAAGRGNVAGVAVWIAVMFVSVLFHELGHALAARRYGYRPWIRLHGMGGTTHYDGSGVQGTWRSEVAISLAGPFAGLLLGGIVALMAGNVRLAGMTKLFVSDMLWANLVWSVWNLMPILPYDGGQAFHAVALRLFPRRGHAIAHGVGITLALAGVVGSLVFRQWWIAYLYARSVGHSWRALRDADFARRLARAWERWDGGDVEAARAEAEALFTRASNDPARGAAIELETFLALRRMREGDARAALERYPAEQSPSALLSAVVAFDGGDLEGANRLFAEVSPALAKRVLHPIVLAWAAGEPAWRERAGDLATMPLPAAIAMPLGEALFYAGHFDLAAALEERAFEAFGIPEAAYNAACSHARAGRGERAVEWLGRALEAGFDDFELLDKDTDLDAIRPEVERLRAAHEPPAARVS